MNENNGGIPQNFWNREQRENETRIQNSKRKAELEEEIKIVDKQTEEIAKAQRLREDYRSSREEVEKNLILGLTLLKEDVVRVRKLVVGEEETIAVFEEELRKVQALQESQWSDEEYKERLTKASAVVKNVQRLWNDAQAKLPVLGEDGNATEREFKGGSLPSILSLSPGQIMKLGILLHWPTLILTLCVLLGIVLHFLK